MPRNTVLKKYHGGVAGGISQVTRDLFRTMFLGDRSLATAGLALPIGADGPLTIRMHMAGILADEEALNNIWFIKGASGVCPCAVLCSVTNKQRPEDVDAGLRALTDIDGDIKDISCPDITLCGPRSNQAIWNMADQVKAALKKERITLEHCTGLKYAENTLLFDIPLRTYVHPATHTVLDAMHVLFSNGILNSEIMLFMEVMQHDVGAYFGDVRQFAAGKGWRPTKALDAISEVRERSSHEMLKAGASEVLAVYPLLRAFVVGAYGATATEPHVKSLLLLCQICDIIRIAMRDGNAEEAAHTLRDLSHRYLLAFVEAYGRDKIRFKHHQLLHLPQSMARLKRLLTCFVTERKHIMAKLAMQHVKDPSVASDHGMSRMLNGQILALEAPGWLSVLSGSPKPFPEMALSLGAQRMDVSRSMRWNGISLTSNEVIFLDRQHTYLVIVVCCSQIDDSFGLLVRTCTRVSGTDTASCWHVDPDASVHRLTNECVFKVAFHRYVSSDTLEILL